MSKPKQSKEGICGDGQHDVVGVSEPGQNEEVTTLEEGRVAWHKMWSPSGARRASAGSTKDWLGR